MKNLFIPKRINNLITYVTLASVTFFAFLPHVTSAYAILDQSAARLNDNTILFQVDYRLNYLNYDTYAPIFPFHVNETSTSSPYIQYSLVDEAGNKVAGLDSTSLVLSQADIVDNQYYITDGESRPFSLVSFVTLPPELVATSGALALQIDWLPFTLVQDGKESDAAVRQKDLTNDFKTPLISW